MSLFRLREFWSFDLNQLNALCNRKESVSEDKDDIENNKEEANFIVRTGRFTSIGGYDVFVCGSLEGLLCILQVPKREQQLTNDNEDSSGNRRKSSEKGDEGFLDHHLLVAHDVGFPIVDLRCAFYTSTLKQSIAVLSFDKLAIYQVKKRQVDLLSSDLNAINQKLSSIDENLLSHKVEKIIKFDLLRDEIASDILIINNHEKNDLVEKAISESDSANSNLLKHREKSSNSVLFLPQRDAIVIKYTNQLIFSLVEHKRVVGHFQLHPPFSRESSQIENQKDEREVQVQQLAHYVGSMPMAFVKDPVNSSLIVTTSDREIYCLPLTKITAQAKQNVMKRVTQTLLQEKETKVNLSSEGKKSSLAYDNITSFSEENVIFKDEIDLLSVAIWQSTLTNAPLQIDVVNRAEFDTSSSSMSTSQLLIMSRYSIDLFSSTSCTHLWSHQFETPIICTYSYCLHKEVSDQSGAARLLNLVCTDNLSNDKCNFSIMEEDRLVWTALLGTRAAQMCRANLSRMSGVLTTLDINESRLSLSYLGTNLESTEIQFMKSEEDEGNNSVLSQLEKLDDHVLSSDEELNHEDFTANIGEPRKLLIFEVRLEASEQWPNIHVNSYIGLTPESSTCTILQNIEAILEFDDLIVYKPLDNLPKNVLSTNVILIQLGSCWPDRREPISFSGCFSMQPQASVNFALLPKSLKVNVLLKLNVNNTGTQIQEESFMLPLNMVAQLVHIDYSTSQDQSLREFRANLNLYKGLTTTKFGCVDTTDNQEISKLFLSDLCIKTPGGILNLIDEIIESDLICRGMNSESKSGRQRLRKEDQENAFSTMENINLLAQSLDCRLRYKSLSHPASINQQLSEEYFPVVILSSAFTISSGALTMQNCEMLSSAIGSGDNHSTVWLHVCDLTNQSTVISEEVVRQHSKVWKTFDFELEKKVDSDEKNFPKILLTIEGEHPVPVLFFQSHLIERLKKRFFIHTNQELKIHPLNESTSDAIDITFSEILRSPNWLAININLHDSLRSFFDHLESSFKDKYQRLKEDLDTETFKFHISTMTSLSTSKRLSNLPPNMLRQFNNLSGLTKKYQLNLIKTLSELEKLKQNAYYYSKLASVSEIVIENSKHEIFLRLPYFIQLIDSSFH